MSGVVNVRIALETALNAMTPAIATAWENITFTPPASTVPYQQCWVLFATPDNLEWGSRHIEKGIFQITLKYPLLTGTAAIAARAELIRTTFKRGASFVNSGVTVTIERTPEISGGSVDGDKFSLPVKVRFFAQIP